MAVRPGDIVDLSVERPVAGGRMLARADGQVILVAGAIPGERVRARVTRADRHVVLAQMLEAVEASADRRAAAADPDCGGLLFSHIDYARQLTLKGEIVQDAFRRLARHPLELPPAVRGASSSGYRLRARLHVRGGRVGFFREGTHEICDAAMTRQLPPESHLAIDAVVARLGDRRADIAHVIVAENVRASERVMHLVPREGVRIDAAALPSDALPGVTGVTFAAGPRILVVSGAATVTGEGSGSLTRTPMTANAPAPARRPAPRRVEVRGSSTRDQRCVRLLARSTPPPASASAPAATAKMSDQSVPLSMASPVLIAVGWPPSPVISCV